MSEASGESIVSAFASLDVPCERTTPDEFQTTLKEHIGDPAVGVHLRDADVSLPPEKVTVNPTPAQLKRAHTGVTPAEFAIDDYGSVVVPSSSDGAELVSLFVDRHVAVVDATEVVPGMDAAFDRFGEHLRATGGSSVIATGASATADMGALVHGAHGPGEVHVILLEDADE